MSGLLMSMARPEQPVFGSTKSDRVHVWPPSVVAVETDKAAAEEHAVLVAVSTGRPVEIEEKEIR